MAAHRYWRARGIIHNGGAFSGTLLALYTEIEFKAASGGADLATSAQAIGTDGFAVGTSEDPPSAFDNNTGTFWQGGGAPSANVFIGQDFGGSPQEIVEVTMRNHASYNTRTWHTFVVEYSDDNVTWEVAWFCFPGSTWTGAVKTFTMPTANIASRYWRLYVGETHGGGSHIAASDFELFQGVSSVALTGGTWQVKDTLGGYPTTNINDGSDATFWHASVAGPSFIGYDFGAGNEKNNIDGFGWRARPDDPYQYQTPRVSDLLYSQNGVDFLRTAKFSDNTNWFPSERRRYRKKIDDLLGMTHLASVALTNPGGETGDATGWNATTGGVQAFAGGRTGSYHLRPTDVVRAAFGQTVDFDAAVHEEIDGGTALLRVEAYHNTFASDADNGVLTIDFYDESDAWLYRRMANRTDYGAYWLEGMYVPIPAGARSARIGTRNIRTSGTANDNYWDDFTLDIYTHAEPVTFLAHERCESAASWVATAGALSSRANNGHWLSDPCLQGQGGTNVTTEGYRQLVIPADAEDDVDAGLCEAAFEFNLCGNGSDANDTARCWVEFRDGGGAVLSTAALTGAAATQTADGRFWRCREAIPATTRTMRFYFESKVVGTAEANADGYLNRLAVWMNGVVPTVGGGGSAGRRRQMIVC